MKAPTADGLLAQRLVDGLLSGPERAAFEARLSEEPGLARLVEELRLARVVLSGPAPATRVPAGFAERMAGRLCSGRGEAEETGRFLRKLALAASFLLFLGLGSLAWLHTSQGGGVLEGDDLDHRYRLLLEQARSAPAGPVLVPPPRPEEQR